MFGSGRSIGGAPGLVGPALIVHAAVLSLRGPAVFLGLGVAFGLAEFRRVVTTGRHGRYRLPVPDG